MQKGKPNKYDGSSTGPNRDDYLERETKRQTQCNMCVEFNHDKKLKVICEGSEYKLCKKCYYMAFAAQLSANIPLSHLINL